MKNQIKEILKNKKILSYSIIILATIFTCIPLFSKYMDISLDDGIQHICRIIGTHASLKEGNMFPVIMSGLCEGFGYSWNIFYSPLTAYLPLIFKLFTDSYVVCLKLFMFFTMLLSGIFMYKLVYKIHKTHTSGIIAALIYITAPYHLTDLYTRIAIAELTSFMFLPIVFIGMYDLCKENKRNALLTIGAIGLTLTHNVITIYTAIFCLIYLLINYKNVKNKQIMKIILINVLIILLCTSFYWIPLLEHYLATTYEVFIPGRMFTNDVLIESKLSIMDLFIDIPWGLNFHIGLPIIFGLILTFIYRNKVENKYQKDIVTFLAFGCISIIMTLKIFPFEYLPNVLKMLQFTWRMMEFEIFFLSIVSGVMITIFIKNSNTKRMILAIIFIIYTEILILSAKEMTQVPFNEDKYITPIPLKTIVGPIYPGCATLEYLPKRAFENLKYIKTRTEKCIILEGIADIVNENKNGTKLTFEVKNVNDKVVIELPYIYYLGYSAKLIEQNDNSKSIKIKESNKGFCMIEVADVESGTIEITYEGTMAMKTSYALTFIGIFLLLLEKMHI